MISLTGLSRYVEAVNMVHLLHTIIDHDQIYIPLYSHVRYPGCIGLRGYVVLTGASSGIGYHLARILCSEGYRVLGIGRNHEALEGLRREYSGCFDYLVLDLSDPRSIDEIVDYVSREYGQLDVLINNAGYAIHKPLLEHSPREIEDIVLVNTVRPIQLVIRLVEYMKPGSVVVNVITSGVYVRLYSLPSYGLSKAALHYASIMLDKELKKRGIRLVKVYPGPVKTRFFERAGAKTPSKLILDPEKVAKAVYKAIRGRRKTLYLPQVLWILPIITKYPLPISYKP